MRVVGFCERCRKIKQVTVKVWMSHTTAIGKCQQCEDEERARK